MDLAQRRCLDVLGMTERLADPKSVTDEQLALVVHLTGAFQTRLGVANCRKVTSEGCQVLGGCEPLRHLDLSGTAVADLKFAYMLEQLQTLALARCRELTLLSGLLGCRRLVRVNVRYTNIEDVVPLAASQARRANANTALFACGLRVPGRGSATPCVAIAGAAATWQPRGRRGAQ